MKNLKIKKKLGIFLLIYVVCFIYSFFFSTVYNDEIWNYGFAYNIASGLVPYRDFNLVITPLYSFLAAVFLKLFGNYLISFHLFNSIIFTTIVYIIYDKLNYKGFILLPLVFLNCYPGYNMLSMLLVLLIINITDKDLKNKDSIIGLLVGLMFLTKQHIGICFFLPLLYYSKNKLKGLISFLIPIFCLLVYLIINEAFFKFIDYCFLGLLEFGNSNNILLFLPFEIIVCIVILYKLFKSKFENKQLFYVLMYQAVTVPIFDDYHFMIGIIPCIYYLLFICNVERYKIKYFIIISLFFFFFWNFKIHEFEKINFYYDVNSYLYLRNIPTYVHLNEITKYIEEQSNNYDHIYFFSKNSYYVKLNAKYRLDKFDLINNGNMGYNGIERYIKEIDDYCYDNKCMFILYKYEFFVGSNSQTNFELVNYVKDNYFNVEDIDVFEIYVSK